MTKRVRTATAASPEPERDLWFNPHLAPRSSRAHQVIGIPVLALKTHDRKRALRGRDADTFHKVMIALLSNLIVHYLRGSPGNGVPVPRSNKVLGKMGDRYQPFSFPRSFPEMLDALSDLGFAEVTLGKYSGFPGQSKRTAVKAGQKLIGLIEQNKLTLDDFSGSLSMNCSWWPVSGLERTPFSIGCRC